MNYLAHLFLAENDDGLILGALLEDYIVGGIETGKNQLLPEVVKNGLKLHRFIDSFTDNSIDLKPCKALFYKDFGKYSPVIMDVILDHYLQKNWITYTDEPFDLFRNRIYHSLNHNFLDLQPLPLRSLIDSMTYHDWLKNYIHFWGLEKALSSLNRRVQHIDLSRAIFIFQAEYGFIEKHFLEFFPKLKQAVQKQILEYGQ